jgi:hypothetical protein
MFLTGLSDVAMLWRFSRIAWAWRRKTRRVWRRTSLILLACILQFATFAVAGLFSSRVADAADEVLIQASPDCGWYDTNQNYESGEISNLNDEQLNSLDSYAISWRTTAVDARSYAISCYPWLDGSVPNNASASCASYVVPQISSTISSTACPFAARACSAPAISFDSGWIDSHVHLGINAQEKDRVQVKRKTICAPIPIEENYSLPWNDTFVPGIKFKVYEIGPLTEPTLPYYWPPNATFVVQPVYLAEDPANGVS